ncbi:MAG: transketolase, partial [Bifidobacteriaceae bacterium]|nr:transketolase [Bifidobacteriaceae bacterium]
EDVAARFAAQGWRVSKVPLAGDGEVDVAGLDTALSQSTPGQAQSPHLVMVRSHIAWPAPHAFDTSAAHGAPLGAEETAATKTLLGVAQEAFTVDGAALDFARQAEARGRGLHRAWDEAMDAWSRRRPDLATRWRAAMDRVMPADLDERLLALARAHPVGDSVSTRDASHAAIQVVAAALPELLGGSADLSEPNRTTITNGGALLPANTPGACPAGRNIHWGVREHAMTAAMNGLVLAGGVRAFSGTFLAFSDYQRPAIRLAALMGLPAIYVWTHDSIAVGQDGPTHQPIEQLASLRAMPGLAVLRPADAQETAAAWGVAIRRDGPTGLVLSRQPVAVLDADPVLVAQGVRRGAYTVSDEAEPDAILIGTGSEVALAIKAAESLRAAGRRVRVVSMPSREIFRAQPAEYRESVLPGHSVKVVVEAASPFGWGDVVGVGGEVVGIDRFGASGSAADLAQAFDMTADAVVTAAERALSRQGHSDRSRRPDSGTVAPARPPKLQTPIEIER